MPNQTRCARPERLFLLGIFLAMFAFFYAAHPLVLLSLDDWAYFTQVRIALPFPNFWNPSRILPEVLMPLCGVVAGLLYPLVFDDYVQAQVFTVAVVFSFFISLYVYAFLRLIRRHFGLSRPVSMLLALLFLLLHFLIFRSRETGNEHLLSTRDVCCCFFYTIPALLCASLVMLDLADDLLAGLFLPGELSKKALLALALYMGVFSNLFGSAILAVYLGCRVLIRLAGALRRHEPAGGTLRAELPRLLLLGLWLLAALLEALGGRASVSYRSDETLLRRIAVALASLRKLCASMNPLFLALLAAAALAALLVLLLRRRWPEKSAPYLRLLGGTLLCGLLCTLFLVLLSAVAAPDYTELPYASFGCFFYLLLPLCFTLAWALDRFPRCVLLLPLALLVLYTATNTGARTFADPNCLYVSSDTIMEIDRDLIAQLREADAAGLNSVELHTLASDMYGNWPHTQALGEVLSNLFWKSGVLSRRIEVTIVPDPAFNEAHSVIFGQAP